MREKIGITIDKLLTNDFTKDLDKERTRDWMTYNRMVKSFDLHYLTEKVDVDRTLSKSWFQRRGVGKPKIIYHEDPVQASLALQLDYLMVPNYSDYVFPLRTSPMQVRRLMPSYDVVDFFDEIVDRRSWS